jgi:hypothetical protein
MTTKKVRVSLQNIENYNAVVEVPADWTDEQIQGEIYQESQVWHGDLPVEDNEMTIKTMEAAAEDSAPNFRLSATECVRVW